MYRLKSSAKKVGIKNLTQKSWELVEEDNWGKKCEKSDPVLKDNLSRYRSFRIGFQNKKGQIGPFM